MEPDAVEIRVLGCLLEKQRTTPDAYPLSLNALRLACNQATNRDPVVEYDESMVRDALRRLAQRSWTRLASGPGSRAPKYRQLFEETLGLAADEVALLAVLMLRGPQTPGELKQRADRLHRFAGLGEVHDALGRLIEKEHVERLPRRPGQKEERYRHLLGGNEEPVGGELPTGAADEVVLAGEEPVRGSVASGSALDEESAPEDRLDRLERELAELRDEVRQLREAVGD